MGEPRHFVLGIDPGVKTLGFALINAKDRTLHNHMTVKLDLDDFELSLRRLEGQLLNFLPSDTTLVQEHGEWTATIQYVSNQEIDAVAIENYAVYGFSGAIINAAKMGEIIRFVMEILCREAGVPRSRIFRYRGTDVRDHICGNRRAKDTQVRECLHDEGFTQRMNNHTRDALSVALYHYDTHVLKEDGADGVSG